eukprot:TRINITY_DN18802_c0_g1_i1.p1 TRINITY_DN18802_c0_g1~~TRINITY_DN18802_c0_g1_i1.p1  ORF type:complete len:148 (-),score=24.09 TRINITY_DN18802_c0_g1_i1:19-462(-)
MIFTDPQLDLSDVLGNFEDPVQQQPIATPIATPFPDLFHERDPNLDFLVDVNPLERTSIPLPQTIKMAETVPLPQVANSPSPVMQAPKKKSTTKGKAKQSTKDKARKRKQKLTETPGEPPAKKEKDMKIGRAVQQECRDRSRMPSSA